MPSDSSSVHGAGLREVSRPRGNGGVRSGAKAPDYVLITPARNEEKHIGRVLAAVAAQTQRPLVWVIVSDGSTDRTDDIVSTYVQRHGWIRLLRLTDTHERSFASKVESFRAGYGAVADLPFEVVGNLDADISVEPDYFEFLMNRFAEDPRLGVAGTPFVERGTTYDYRFTNVEHVSGACQLFRRECFADVGEYVPIKGGGVDWVAVTTARMKGWKTRTFTEKSCAHHRPMGTSSAGRLQGAFRQGRKDYYLGGHPIWQVFRAVYQMVRPPLVAGGTTLMAGYVWAWIRRQERPVSPELVRFHRQEQMARLRRILRMAAQGGR